MGLSRRIAGVVALVTYLVMGALTYLWVLPGAEGHWPPDFHLRGYDAASIAPFVTALSAEAEATYLTILSGWDRVFIVTLALWLALVGWLGGGLRFVVAGLAALYAVIDLSENAAILRFVTAPELDPQLVKVAHNLTMAKFSSLYLCILVLIWHLRRAR